MVPMLCKIDINFLKQKLTEFFSIVISLCWFSGGSLRSPCHVRLRLAHQLNINSVFLLLISGGHGSLRSPCHVRFRMQGFPFRASGRLTCMTHGLSPAWSCVDYSLQDVCQRPKSSMSQTTPHAPHLFATQCLQGNVRG
jgi:hypothetical protein